MFSRKELPKLYLKLGSNAMISLFQNRIETEETAEDWSTDFLASEYIAGNCNAS